MPFIEVDCVEENEDTCRVGYYKAMLDISKIESFVPEWDDEMKEVSKTRIFFKSGFVLVANVAYSEFKKIFQANATKYIEFKN